jgi:hypothetical protein
VVEFRRLLTRSFALKLGYQLHAQTVGPGSGQTRVQDFLLGLGYSTSLTAATRVSASAGSTVVERAGSSRRLRAAGNALVVHQFGRAWLGSAAYARGVDFVEGIADAATYDSVRLGLSGSLTRRFSLGGTVAYRAGRVIAAAGQRPYSQGQVAASFQYDVGRQVRLFARYTAYRYTFPSDAVVAAGVPSTANRQSAAVGATLFAGRRIQ